MCTAQLSEPGSKRVVVRCKAPFPMGSSVSVLLWLAWHASLHQQRRVHAPIASAAPAYTLLILLPSLTLGLLSRAASASAAALSLSACLSPTRFIGLLDATNSSGVVLPLKEGPSAPGALLQATNHSVARSQLLTRAAVRR